MLKSPDWEYWGRMRDVTLRDALVLSLDLCPNAYNHETESRKAQKFAKRYLSNFQIVKSHIYGSDWLVGRVSKKEYDVDAAFTTVDLPKFCKWAFGVVKLVDLPEQMKLLGDPDWVAPHSAPAVVEPETPPISRQIKGGRRDILSPVIDKARGAADNPDKWQEVWPRLCELAEDKVLPLIGVADTSVKYQDGDIVKILNKDNFRKRMARLISREGSKDSAD
jgi:hypothetical protein